MDNRIQMQLRQAKEASRYMQNIKPEVKEKALKKISDALLTHVNLIIQENQKDILDAKNNGIKESMVDRLLLTRERIEAMAQDILKVVELNDPIGEVVRTINRPNGLLIKQVRVPLGVIGIIYESRPNVTVDIASLCIKTNNVCVLKGGKEAIHSNRILVKIMNEAIKDLLPENCIVLIETTQREQINELIQAHDYVDVIIPRGSAGLIQYVVKNATVPIIETGAGRCHLYVDKEANLNMALEIAINAKIQRPSVCNAIETIIVHQDVAPTFLPMLQDAFNQKVTLYGDERTQQIISCLKATSQNYATEYDDYICNIKVVEDINEAISHIYQYSTKHSESIVTENKETAQYFMDALDSACLYHNASTRFTDGGQFGFGAEVGISTQKLHARGPLGLPEITSTKYLIYGNGQIRK
ncbi:MULTISPECIES: glutamate-5-semialdehyde dehydrogenase [Coprobacillaceae]|uniref:glutamate-5-semialdehyde dehydrogenase n=1 Tax=Coprobacillaceae TaxID=2810280 RepID=UPI000E554923|nr:MULTISPECIES: glutamate-5-semialdehyde dehydrogenase [Coprobacillaceae]RHM63546.1 glutamate-5-semialdehyde dehydrogenase [Coprobacillus sp. AF33-1AC]RHS96275.1 glutamate-5-semialdehyde dehydrogenase [Erysipelatoclostridium sp. AM42-17]